MAPHHPRPAIAPLLLAVAAAAVGIAIAYVFGTQIHELAKGEVLASERGPVLGVLLGAALGIGGLIFALLWYSFRVLGDRHPAHFGQAILFGIIGGSIALVVGPALEKLTAGAPGWLGSTQGSGVVASFIEEAAKLLLPVILLIFVARFRDPILGFWTAVVSGAWFGLLEGIGYVAVGAVDATKTAGTGATTEGIVLGVDVLVRSWSDIGHPLTTGGAAIIIWLAAKNASRGTAVLIGIGAYLVASVLHALDDGVLGYYITNGLFAGLAVLALQILVFFFWYRPQLRRLDALVTNA